MTAVREMMARVEALDKCGCEYGWQECCDYREMLPKLAAALKVAVEALSLLGSPVAVKAIAEIERIAGEGR